MKADKWVTAGIAAVLAFLLAFGTAGGIVTAFALPLKSYPAVVWAWAFSSLFCAAAFSWKRGGILVLGLLVLLAGYLWHRGDLLEQVLRLLYHITYIYDKGYGWGVFLPMELPWWTDFVDLPMALLGAAVSMVTAWTVCRGINGDYAIICALLPLLSCLVVTDTVPGTGNLFALFFAVVMLLLTSRVRSENVLQGNRLTLLAAIPTALALGGLFLAVPQEGYVNQSAAIRDDILAWFLDFPETLESTVQEVTLSVSGSEAENVDLAAMGRRVESTAPVMSVTAEVGGTLYLRGQDYDGYDGTSWTASGHRDENFSCSGSSLGNVTIETQSQLEQLYLPYYPTGGQSLVGGRLENPQLYTQYTFSRTGLPDNWQALTAAGDSAEAPPLFADTAGMEQQTYLALPEKTRSGAEALLAPLFQDAGTTTEKAAAIANFVRNSALYDRNTTTMPSGEEDFALWFLEASETGYCVHFATAAVVLLRAAGIEARYVSGYMVRTLSGQTAVVTGENAHAWAEYYEPGLNTWLVLEATPADLNAQAGNTGEVQATLPSAEPTDEATSASTQPQAAPQNPTEPSASAPSPQVPAPRDFGPVLRLLKFLLLLAAAAAVIEGQRRCRIRLRRRSQRRGPPNAQALARWRETELLAKLLKESPPQKLEVLAQKAKFSQHTLSAEELALFEGYLRTAKKRLRQMPWYLRLAHRYVFAVY